MSSPLLKQPCTTTKTTTAGSNDASSQVVTVAGGVTGLTSAEVRDRVSDGRVNIVDSRVSRSVSSILRENLLTRFNAIMSVMLVIVLVFGRLPDALFGFVMVANAVIGIVQELRAKRTLDKLSVLVEPNVTVVRDSTDVEIPTDEIVLDDVIRLVTGDQVPADGIVMVAGSVQVDESLLTGEADPVHKEAGDSILSGSFVVAGSTTVEITAVGDDAYAQHLAAEAKEFTLAKSELMGGIWERRWCRRLQASLEWCPKAWCFSSRWPWRWR